MGEVSPAVLERLMGSRASGGDASSKALVDSSLCGGWVLSPFSDMTASIVNESGGLGRLWCNPLQVRTYDKGKKDNLETSKRY